jgi:hypothetical protein
MRDVSLVLGTSAGGVGAPSCYGGDTMRKHFECNAMKFQKLESLDRTYQSIAEERIPADVRMTNFLVNTKSTRAIFYRTSGMNTPV